MRTWIAALCGLCLAMSPACSGQGPVKVDNITASGGTTVNGVLTVTSGQPYVFVVTSSSSNLSNCSRVWVVREDYQSFNPVEVPIVDKSTSELRFRVETPRGQEGSYYVYLCQQTRPTQSGPGTYQAQYRVVAPPEPPVPVPTEPAKPSPTTEVKPPAATASRRVAPSAGRVAVTPRPPTQLVRIATLEQQVKELYGLRIQMATDLERMRSDYEQKANKQDVMNVVTQVQAVNQEVRNLANTIQATQTRLDGIDRDLAGLRQNLQGNQQSIDTRLQQHEARMDNVTEGVVTLTNYLNQRTVGGKVLWFIPARVLSKDRAQRVEMQVRRQPVMQPAVQPTTTDSPASAVTVSSGSRSASRR